MGDVLCSTENSPFLIIDHIHAKINRVCCAALAIGKKCMNVRKNKLFYNAITQNNREIDRVNKNELYIATVSIKLFLLTL